MQINVLGTGAADSTYYFHSSFAFKIEKDEYFLIDTGGGYQLLRQLKEKKINLNSINHIFITHKHIDHFLGIFWILRRQTFRLKQRNKKLKIYCPNGTKQFLENSGKELLKEKIINEIGGLIEIIELNDRKKFTIGEFNIKPLNLESSKEEQFGFILQDKSIKIAFLGDEIYRGQFDEELKGVDILFHDAYCTEELSENFDLKRMCHSTVKDAAVNAQRLNVKNLILHHTEENLLRKIRKEVFIKEATKYYKGEVFAPDDLETLQF